MRAANRHVVWKARAVNASWAKNTSDFRAVREAPPWPGQTARTRTATGGTCWALHASRRRGRAPRPAVRAENVCEAHPAWLFGRPTARCVPKSARPSCTTEATRTPPAAHPGRKHARTAHIPPFLSLPVPRPRPLQRATSPALAPCLRLITTTHRVSPLFSRQRRRSLTAILVRHRRSTCPTG
ncbi:hypothetical protein L226DRAFT_507520, partial [Lentinus tigrinus ALCF2SS1-7]|uniref:uncharacterized protein n=1 Tax=Lentinus tigrinus ALCF2SS1-7 TaxID=1328758 RepID=UPI0011663226